MFITSNNKRAAPKLLLDVHVMSADIPSLLKPLADAGASRWFHSHLLSLFALGFVTFSLYMTEYILHVILQPDPVLCIKSNTLNINWIS